MVMRVKGFFIIIGVMILVYLGIKYMLPLIIPFVIAFFITLLIHPFVEKLHKKLRLNRGIITGTILFITTVIIGSGFWLGMNSLFSQVRRMYENMEFYVNQLKSMLDNGCKSLEGMLGINADFLKEFIMENVDRFFLRFQENSIPHMMENSIGYMILFIEVLGIGMIIFISIILLTKDFNGIKEDQKQYFYYKGLRTFGTEVMRMSKNYIKAQFMIMTIIAVVCIAGLLILRNAHPILLGIFIGLFDALPVLGTGFIFVPWALIHFVQGNYFYAAVYLTLYVVCSMVREFLEPKLIGEKLGMPSIMVLLSVYIGIKLFGITGILTGPLGYLLIKGFTTALFKTYHISLREEN